MSDLVLELIDLRKKYKEQIALDGLSMKVNSGSIHGFIGPNGAGKTTAINIISNIITRDSGKVFIFNKEITESSWSYKRNVGFVLETATYIDKLTVVEFLRYCGAMHRMPVDDINEKIFYYLTLFELAEKQNSLIDTLSRGMKKKVSLTAALIHSPDLIILDEPFEGMDTIAMRRTKNIILEMKDAGKTFIVTSHIMDYVEDICDNISIINNGQVAFEESMDNVKAGVRIDPHSKTRYHSLEDVFINVVQDTKE